MKKISIRLNHKPFHFHLINGEEEGLITIVFTGGVRLFKERNLIRGAIVNCIDASYSPQLSISLDESEVLSQFKEYLWSGALELQDQRYLFEDEEEGEEVLSW